MTKRALRAAPIALACLVSAAEVFAQDEPSAADVGAARSLGQEGVKLADAGNCEDAIERLTRAEKMFHAPTTLGRLGECQVQVGKLVEGSENLNRVAREPLAANAPPAFAQAQERAKKVLAEAKPKIPKLKIAVAAPPTAKLVVTIDGESIPLANLNTNRPVNPGEHVIEATAPGYIKSVARVKLAEGSVDSVALTLEADPNAPKGVAAGTAPASSDPTLPSPPAEAGSSSSRTPAYVSLGVGVVGLGVGTIFGVFAMGKKSDLDDVCPNKQCPASAQDTVDSGETLGTVSTIGFAVGIVGLAVGTVFLLTSGSSGTRAQTTTKPTLGLGGAGLAGTF